MLLGLSNAGIGNFGVVALMSGYGVTFSAANIALTAFLGASAAGVLAGGYLADRTTRHGQVAAACFGTGWALNIIGHAAYEGRAPAFSEDALSFVAGPVWDLQQLTGRFRAA